LLGAYILACEREHRFVLAGFLGGCSVVTEYPLVIAQAAIVVFLLTGPDRWQRSLRYVAGALPMAFLMFLYNKAITGRWTDFPYSHVNASWEPMRLAFGIRAPDPLAMWELAFGQYRGLAFYASILIVLLPALVKGFAGPPRRRLLVLGLLGTYFLFVSAYFKWDGGWCTGPRHLVPVLVLTIYEGVAALAHQKRGWILFALLAFWGIALSISAAATSSIPPESNQHPAFEVFFPRVWSGDLTSHNLGVELGLKNGRYLLFVWAALFLGGAWLCGWLFARADATVGRDLAADPPEHPVAELIPSL
jgi:hypothetical protein